MKQGSIQCLMQVLVACWALCVAMPAKALELQITPDITSVNLDIGDTFTVLGRVTNITGVGLRTTDIFLNFSGYADAALELAQLLGDPDLPLPDRDISDLLALFSVTVLPGAAGGSSYQIDFFGMDINGVFSEAAAVTVTVNASQGVAEPFGPLLAMTALVMAWGTGRRRNCAAVVATSKLQA